MKVEAAGSGLDINANNSDIGGVAVTSIAANVITATALATSAVDEISDGVWDEQLSGHTTAGSAGKALSDAGSAGDPWGTALPGAYGAGTAGHIVGTALPDIAPGSANGLLRGGTNAATSITTALTANIIGNVTGNLSGSVGSVTGAVGSVTGAVGSVTGNVTGSVGSLATQAKADVNGEVLDVMSVDTFAEPTGVPAATATLSTKLGRLHQALRNGLTVTATDKTFQNDAGADLWKKPLSDDATTFTEGEGTTP